MKKERKSYLLLCEKQLQSNCKSKSHLIVLRSQSGSIITFWWVHSMKDTLSIVLLRLGIIRDLGKALWKHKLWWSLPIIFILIFIMIFLFISGYTGISAFVYPLFWYEENLGKMACYNKKNNACAGKYLSHYFLFPNHCASWITTDSLFS